MALNTGLTGAWKLDNDALDSSGLGNDLTYSGVSFTTGKINQGFSYTSSMPSVRPPIQGSNDYISASGFATAIWVNINNISGNRFLFCKDESTGTSRNFQFRLDSAVPSFYRFNGSSLVTSLVAPSAITPNVWHLLVATFNNTEGSKIYVDNVMVASDTVLTNNNVALSTRLFIGSDTVGTNNLLGTVDMPAVWNHGLTASDVNQLWNGGNGIQTPFPAPPVVVNTSFFNFF